MDNLTTLLIYCIVSAFSVITLTRYYELKLRVYRLDNANLRVQRDAFELQLDEYLKATQHIPGDTLSQRLHALLLSWGLHERRHYPYDQS